jgi:hypothetical protein
MVAVTVHSHRQADCIAVDNALAYREISTLKDKLAQKKTIDNGDDRLGARKESFILPIGSNSGRTQGRSLIRKFLLKLKQRQGDGKNELRI